LFSPDRPDRSRPLSLLAAPLPGIVQPKLAVGRADAPLEREADRVADQVMRKPDANPAMTAAPGQLSRKGGDYEEEQKEHKPQTKATTATTEFYQAPDMVQEVLRAPGQPLDPTVRALMEPRFQQDFSRVRVHSDAPVSANAAKSIAHSTAAGHARGQRLQRKCACEESGTSCERCASEAKSMQRMAIGSLRLGAVPPIVHDVLASPGKPLDPSTRGFMEERFGQDFSRVRVHTDAGASISARSVGALAYAVGHDIVFGSNMYAPQSQSGRHILAHELAHVVQQRGSSGRGRGDLRIEDEGSASESEAERAASDAMSGRPVRLGTAALGLHRVSCEEILLAKETPLPGSVGKLTGMAYEAEIVSFARRHLRDRIIPKFSIEGASAQAKRGEGCGKAKEAIAEGNVDLAITGDEPGVIEIAEIKIGTVPCRGLAETQLGGYLEKGNAPENKKWSDKKEIQVREVKRMPTSRIDFSGYRLLPGTLPLLVNWCNDGVILYKPVDEKEPEKRGEKGPPAFPTGQALTGFALGFVAGWRQTVPGETWIGIYQKLSQPENYAIFMGAQIPGRIVGMVASITDLITALGSLLKMGLELSPAGIAVTETMALVKGEESPTVRRLRLARAIAEGLPVLAAEIERNPNLFFDAGVQFGNVCGEEAGRRFAKELASASPAEMGYIVGKVEGYLAAEVAMLLIGAEEIAGVGKIISRGARALKASPSALELLAVMRRIAAFRGSIEAAEASKKLRVAAEVGAEVAETSKKVRVGTETAEEVAEAEPAIEGARHGKVRELSR
jgi:hypothetical protein